MVIVAMAQAMVVAIGALGQAVEAIVVVEMETGIAFSPLCN